MRQKKILIIDDNNDLTDGLCMVLEDEGYHVTNAYNGKDGIAKFLSGKFDVVLLDVKMPDISGVDVFRIIHKNDADAKIIMMTGFRIEQLILEVMDDGEVEIFRSPFEKRRILDIFNRSTKESIIFVADDSPDTAEKIFGYLTEHGMKSIISRDPNDAVDVVLENSIDVLVLDLRRPIMCSLEVYLELKQRAKTVKTIIIAGYDKDEIEAVDTFRSISVTGCLFKPFRPEKMLKAIEKVLNQ